MKNVFIASRQDKGIPRRKNKSLKIGPPLYLRHFFSLFLGMKFAINLSEWLCAAMKIILKSFGRHLHRVYIVN